MTVSAPEARAMSAESSPAGIRASPAKAKSGSTIVHLL